MLSIFYTKSILTKSYIYITDDLHVILEIQMEGLTL